MNYRAARLKKIAHRLHRQGKFAESKEAQQLFKKAMQSGGRHGRGPSDEEIIEEATKEQQDVKETMIRLGLPSIQRPMHLDKSSLTNL